jgi:hypothetical protein
VGDFTGLSASPEFMSTETFGGTAHERSVQGNSILTHRQLRDDESRRLSPIVCSLQHFLLEITRV